MMRPSSLPHATRQRIAEALPPQGAAAAGPSAHALTRTASNGSAGFSYDNSWTSSRGVSSLATVARPAIAWSDVRHQLHDNDKDVGVATKDQTFVMGHCNQAVMITCLHLAHEMALRDVGMYAWMYPSPKDPSGSTLRIMKGLAHQMQEMDATSTINIRSVPDPSKKVVQHHLQRARLAAGPDNYVAVLYSGHGIQEPPTEAGELWCYDKSFEECAADGSGPSEYIPILMFDLMTWAGASTCYVWDCQHAGRFIAPAKTEAEEIDSQLRAAASNNPSVAEMHPPVYASRQIHLAACGANESLPRVPGLPDDLFTACLTTPLHIALLYHNLQTFPLTTSGDTHHYLQRSPTYMTLLWDNMSKTLKNRLWSELCAILHTIAWQTIPSKDYQLLFGQNGDAISNLGSGFLLSQRVLGNYRTHPTSLPAIPSSTSHQLWIHWDLILDNLFEQLPDYFDNAKIDHGWEEGLKLVSFMEDQLGSILTSNQTYGSPDFTPEGNTAALSRLPIICQAACTPEFRETACNALDVCLQHLDLPGLDHAVNCGTLDVAVQLLVLKDPKLSEQMISIWASLIRHPSCIKRLSAPIKQAPIWIEEPSIKFFLNNLESYLTSRSEKSGTTIVRCAAILATLVNQLPGQSRPHFLPTTLGLSVEMLQDHHCLVQQWGALLTAEILGCLKRDPNQAEETIDQLMALMFGCINSKSVETRATMVYGLARWIPGSVVEDIEILRPSIQLATRLLNQANIDASLLVRKEVVHLYVRLLTAAGKWSNLATWSHILRKCVGSEKGKEANTWTKGNPYKQELSEVFARGNVDKDKRLLCDDLSRTLMVLAKFQKDPNRTISRQVASDLSKLTEPLRGMCTGKEGVWDQVMAASFPAGPGYLEWTKEMVELVKVLGIKVAESFLTTNPDAGKPLPKLNNELFQRSKLSLQKYISKANAGSSLLEQLKGQPQNTQEKTWILRHRILEDSLVVAEQQVGLPWKWQMKDIAAPEPWSNIVCHSFHSAVMSCNNSNDLLLWDWASSKKIGHIHIDLAPGAHIKAGRFVNELHDNTAVLAEISTGDIYVYSGPPNEPTQMKLISSFLALDIERYPMKIYDPRHKQIVSSWWRQSGILAVGGSSRDINVWDCPAEQRIRVLDAGEDVPMTTLITEPKQGNLFIAGFANGIVKLYDQRQSRRSALLSWQADSSDEFKVSQGQPIMKLGVVLGESRNFTQACANGLINIHDLRNLSAPVSTVLAHPSGISSASFQAHSGLMSTISTLNPRPSGNLDLSTLSLNPQNKPFANFGLFRSTLSMLSSVTEDQVIFEPQSQDVVDGNFKPYTFIHPLRPFLSLGYGRTCLMRGSGVGKGDTTDSGSYSFLRAQANFVE